MILKYLSFGISLVFISFIVGMITTSILRNTNFYNNRLSNFNFIKSEKLNSIMGVNIVKWIVKNTFFKYLNPNLKINGKVNISDFKNIREQMTKAEIDHLFAFLFVMIFVIIKIYNEEYI
ncbi:glycosyl-4,4'-diaponeurosporenoate acyltransferase CrtO family protein, partial [Flavobacterium oreochromis]